MRLSVVIVTLPVCFSLVVFLVCSFNDRRQPYHYLITSLITLFISFHKLQRAVFSCPETQSSGVFPGLVLENNFVAGKL